MHKKIYITLFFIVQIFSNLYANNSLFSQKNDNQEIYRATFGNLRVFFYKSPKKSILEQELIKDVRFNMTHGFRSNNSFPISLVYPLAVLYPDPITYNEKGEPLFIDQLGSKQLTARAHQMKEFIEQTLGIEMLGCSPDMNLILNFEALNYHEDDFSLQRQFLKENQLPPSKYLLVNDLSLIDWEMAKGTFSSTLLQDPESEDRFIFPRFPKETVGNFFVEPATSLDRSNRSKDDRISLLKCITPPMDRFNSTTPGSAKGKGVFFALKGLVLEDQIADLESRSHLFSVNRGITDGCCIKYPNGIRIQQLPNKLEIKNKNVTFLSTSSDVEFFEINPEHNSSAIAILNEIFCLNASLNRVVVKYIVKKGEGFTPLDATFLNIPKDSRVVILNNSEIPSSYHYFNLAQDFTKNGLPWIQLYHLPPSKGMLVSGDKINDLSLTPTEEILYRNAALDVKERQLDDFKRKISSKIYLFIFPKES